MSTIAATDLAAAVEDAAAYLYVWALKDIPQDLRDALAAALERETSVPGKRVLETINRNVNIADSEKNLVRLSSLYKWYGGDFEQVAGSALNFAARYSPPLKTALDSGKKPQIEWLDYDWLLNSTANAPK